MHLKMLTNEFIRPTALEEMPVVGVYLLQHWAHAHGVVLLVTALALVTVLLRLGHRLHGDLLWGGHGLAWLRHDRKS